MKLFWKSNIRANSWRRSKHELCQCCTLTLLDPCRYWIIKSLLLSNWSNQRIIALWFWLFLGRCSWIKNIREQEKKEPSCFAFTLSQSWRDVSTPRLHGDTTLTIVLSPSAISFQILGAWMAVCFDRDDVPLAKNLVEIEESLLGRV